jgi:outer membrane murein-binding lipoprotein Lpp
MSYNITKTNGTVLSTPNIQNGTLLDGTIDASIGLSLIGRNYPNYGDAQNENFVRLVENFADPLPPTQSLAALNVLVGTIWYDTSIKKIRVYDGVNWNPASSTIVANATPTSATYTISTGDQWWDTVNNQLNGWNGSQWVLIGPNTGEFAMLEAEIESNVSLLNSAISQLRSDTGSYINSNVATLYSAISQLRSDTGSYINANVTQLRSDTGTYITANIATLNSAINQLRTDTGNYMTANVASLNSDISQLRSDTGSYINANVATLNARIQSNVNTLNATILTLAPINNPTFTGSPAAPTPTVGDNSTKLATTAFVTQAVTNGVMHYTVSSSPPTGGNDGDFWFQI